MTVSKPSTCPECREASASAEGEGETSPSWRKVVWLAAVVTGLLAMVYFSPLREYLGRIREVSEYIRSFGIWAPVVLTAGITILVAAGFPRLVFCVIGGMALGFWSGLLWAQLGTLLGSYLAFLLTRLGGRDWVQRYLAKRGSLHRLVEQEGIWGVLLARQLPLPALTINLACGLFPVRHRDYLLGTLIGQLPSAIPCTLIGAGALQSSFGKSGGMISLAVVMAAVACFGLRWLLRRQRSNNVHSIGQNNG